MRAAVVPKLRLLGLPVLLSLLGCAPAAYDLDTPIAIETSSSVALTALTAGLVELGGVVSAGQAGQRVQVVSECRCPGAAVPNSTVAACTLGGVIYLCPAGLACPRCLKHELGHVFGAGHSADPADLMYPIPKAGVESFSASDKRAICAVGFVTGGVCG